MGGPVENRIELSPKLKVILETVIFATSNIPPPGSKEATNENSLEGCVNVLTVF